MKKLFPFLLLIVIGETAAAQNGYWQQSVKYNMTVDVDVDKNTFSGTQKIEYTNNSSDVLRKVFFHLYLNAFQPGSSMDIRSQELGKKVINRRQDWDGRVRDRIANLKPDEIGYQKISSLKMNGVSQPFTYHGTILELNLTKPIAPKSKVVFDVVYNAQIPVQIRRTGRDNPTTGVRYSMSQWFPKIAEYDNEGWHADPYIAREFYGVWGDFDVAITIDKNYKLGGTGVLINANEIGWGYDKPGTELKPISTAKRTWKFSAKNVHDFVWAADPDYVHLVRKAPSGTMLHIIYNDKPDDAAYKKGWNDLADNVVKLLPVIESKFGKYPYPQYSFIQGGDGGMEYAMATLVISSGLGLSVHEWMHSWYQGILGTNESLYAWMDEGFTTFAEDAVLEAHTGAKSIETYEEDLKANPENQTLKKYVPILQKENAGSYLSYYMLAASGLEEPLTTHADHFNTNYGYSNAAYSKGAVFLEQLGYIVGASVRNKILLEYYNRWKFKHPTINDFVRVAEDVSNMQLQWYKQYWVNSTKTIDYGIDSLWEQGGKALIRVKRIGLMPMPIDIKVSNEGGNTAIYHIPLNLMFGAKEDEKNAHQFFTKPAWDWVAPTYILEINGSLRNVSKIEIDPSKRMADVDMKNNVLELNW